MSVELVDEIPNRGEKKMRRLLLVSSCVFGIALCEILLRLIDPLPSGHFVHQPLLVRSFSPVSEIMPGVEDESLFQINSHGVRGSEIPSEEGWRILTIGGSTTECLYLDQEEAWPTLIQNRLENANPSRPVWVGNAGKTGTSSREHRLQTPILLDDIPDIDTLILLVGVNDVLLRLAVDDKYDPDFVVQPGSHEFLMNRAFDVVRPASANHRIPMFPTRFFGLSLQFLGALVGIEDATAPTHLVEDQSGKFYMERRMFRQNRIATRESLPDLSTGLREFEDNVADCIHAAKDRGVEVILISQPVLWSEGLSVELESLLWTGGVQSISGEGLEYYSTSALSEAMQRYNQRLEELADSESIRYLDLASMLPKDTTVFYDDCHFNEAGSETVGRLLSDFIEAGN